MNIILIGILLSLMSKVDGQTTSCDSNQLTCVGDTTKTYNCSGTATTPTGSTCSCTCSGPCGPDGTPPNLAGLITCNVNCGNCQGGAQGTKCGCKIASG